MIGKQKHNMFQILSGLRHTIRCACGHKGASLLFGSRKIVLTYNVTDMSIFLYFLRLAKLQWIAEIENVPIYLICSIPVVLLTTNQSLSFAV